MTAPLRRDVTPAEEPYLTLDGAQIIAVGNELRAHGYSNAQVAGLEAWLLRKALGEPDLTESKTRARYRRWLAELDAPRPGRGRRSQRGFAEVAVLASMTALAAAVGATRGSPDASALLLRAALDIRQPGGQGEAEHADDAQVVGLDTHRPRTAAPVDVSPVHTLAA